MHAVIVRVWGRMKNTELADFLKTRVVAQEDVADDSSEPACDVVYALFLEPREVADPRWSKLEAAIDAAVRVFQPSPALAHVEILVPPIPTHEALRTSFATYLGRTAAWQTDLQDSISFYLHENGGRWRAVPIIAHGAASRVRAEADCEVGVAYSLARYLTSMPPLRALARFVPNKRRSPAHCATLTARVLSNAFRGSDAAPLHPAAYYGPSTLHSELAATAAWRAPLPRSGAEMPAATAQAIDSLLRGVMSEETVQGLGDVQCRDAVSALTQRFLEAAGGGDGVVQRLAEKQLATALLRWTLLRGRE